MSLDSLNRRTVARYAAGSAPECTTAPGKVTAGSGGTVDSECTTPGGRVTAGSRSLCAPYAGVIAGMAADGLTAQRIWMELRSGHGFGGSYEAVKRFVHRLREAAPQPV